MARRMVQTESQEGTHRAVDHGLCYLELEGSDVPVFGRSEGPRWV